LPELRTGRLAAAAAAENAGFAKVRQFMMGKLLVSIIINRK
jgi:hypothetical protein